MPSGKRHEPRQRLPQPQSIHPHPIISQFDDDDATFHSPPLLDWDTPPPNSDPEPDIERDGVPGAEPASIDAVVHETRRDYRDDDRVARSPSTSASADDGGHVRSPILARRASHDRILALQCRRQAVAGLAPAEDQPPQRRAGQHSSLSLDPTQRIWMRDEPSYLPPVQIGEVMRAIGVGAVVKVGPNTNLSPGDYVTGFLGLQEYAVVPAQQVHKIEGSSKSRKSKRAKPSSSPPPPVPSSLVVQFAKQAGARVVGITGDDDKARYVKNKLGADIVYNYKKPSWKDQFDDQVGLADVYFENVGNDITDFMLTRLKTFGRIAVCGVISEYNVEEGQNVGIRNYIQICLRRLRVQGFIVTDYASKFPDAYKEIGSWLESGSLEREYHVVEGLENAGDWLNLLFTGENKGKLILKVAEPGGEKV
ncbi:hypothetical protein EWM64_g2608 [Hericium alpestre]|uniref:Enoyl reductase (ER) domain-containing protein n=1 Tax=Hericium alpestre TaxID=135208 RepID=A0A4Z0A303_9AGAM|nr:hypothetical protein EWM64_g2608 [Hericium alpestre]